MSDLISRQEVINSLNKLAKDVRPSVDWRIRYNEDAYGYYLGALHDIADDIKDFPTVDAVQVVRCKDCEDWDTEWKPVFGGNDSETHYCPMLDMTTVGDFFCSYGKRKE